MKRILVIALIVFGWVSGCGTGNNGGGGQAGGPSNALDGQYAFVLSGYDSTGAPTGVAGSITADGHGHITGGSVDVNDGMVISSTSSALTGSYTLDGNFRGIFTLTNTIGSVTHPLAFAFTLRSDGASGDLIGLDANGFFIQGTMQRQDPTAFSLSKLAGEFAFEFDQNQYLVSGIPHSTGRFVGIGRFTLGSNGISTNGFADFSKALIGVTRTDEPISFTLAAGPGASGRGTISSSDSGGTASFVYYIVSSGTILVLRTDAAAMTGVISKQNLPFSATTVDTAGAVFSLAGVDATANFPSPAEIAAIGQLQVTNSTSAVQHWDSVGCICGPATASNSTVTFDPTTGRGTITVASGFTNGLFDTAVFYLLDSGKGFILDTTAGPSNRALAGSFRPQTGVGSFALSTLSNNMILRRGPNAGTLDGLLSSGSNNTFTLAIDGRLLGHPDSVNQTTSGLQISSIDANTGRGILTIPIPVPPCNPTPGLPVICPDGLISEVIYIIGTNQFVIIDGAADPQ
jgi:hypothetical protein